ncbi:MAG: hypothetical protein ACI350_01425 [Prevotella sp.]
MKYRLPFSWKSRNGLLSLLKEYGFISTIIIGCLLMLANHFFIRNTNTVNMVSLSCIVIGTIGYVYNARNNNNY